MKKILSTILSFSLIMLLFTSMVVAIELTSKYEPTNNNEKIITLTLSADKETYFYYSLEKGSFRWIKMCNEKELTCIERIVLKEGINNLKFKADDRRGEVDVDEKTIIIDSIAPKAQIIYPRGKIITNGSLFTIRYSEDNLKGISLNYDGKSKQNASPCLSGKNNECDFSLSSEDLTSLDGKRVEFWFRLSDEKRTIDTKKQEMIVDITAPKNITPIRVISEGAKKTFIMDINEANFEGVYLEDEANCLPRFEANTLLCKTLSNGRCVKTKTFCEGEHKIKIIALDQAGNSATLHQEELQI